MTSRASNWPSSAVAEARVSNNARVWSRTSISVLVFLSRASIRHVSLPVFLQMAIPCWAAVRGPTADGKTRDTNAAAAVVGDSRLFQLGHSASSYYLD